MASIDTSRGAVRAVLGPTNTGKTHLAIERMLAHPTGMIGFPLRLLARENYDRIVAQKGASSVALITGEEKIIPPNPQWWVCTVESMPLDRLVDFLAVDEIQLCADPDRGHIFTDRLISARGRSETMFMGSDMVAGLIRQLVPDAMIENRPRYSTLSHIGITKLTRLPRRCAIVAFSVNEVYEIAELVRSQRGGTAVVLGALSPRTRNAQVAMYQAGEVDYLVATDAIGMGLNMDVDHVAFARLGKYDGHRLRRLSAPEIGQIAGRAGRHVNDGTFGTTNNQPAIADEIVAAVEAHSYDPLTKLYWRNRRLDFKSPKALLSSLQRDPPNEHLIRTRDGEDHIALGALLKDAAVTERAQTRDKVELLWDICQVPDFRQMSPDHHAALLGHIFITLVDGDGRLKDDWMSGQLSRLDRLDGDIDTLTNRIAHIRTLAYIAHRNQWLHDAIGWQSRTREIEDRLSDALHERLINRFVDKRGSLIARRGADAEGALLGGVKQTGDVVLEGHTIGKIEGFRFVPADAATAREHQALTAIAERVLRNHAVHHVAAFEGADDSTITLGADRTIDWRGKPVARLARGARPTHPTVNPLFGFVGDNALRQRIEVRLRRWLDHHVQRKLDPVFKLQEAGLVGSAKGLAYRLFEGLGTCSGPAALAQAAALDPDSRKTMAQHGVRFGVETIYIAPLLNAGAVRTRATLIAAWRQHETLDSKLTLTPGKPIDLGDITTEGADGEALTGIGYRRAGPVAFRVDHYETIMADIRKRARKGPFKPDPVLLQRIGGDTAMVSAILHGLGCARAKGPDADLFRLKPRRSPSTKNTKSKSQHGKGGLEGAAPETTAPEATGPEAAGPEAAQLRNRQRGRPAQEGARKRTQNGDAQKAAPQRNNQRKAGKASGRKGQSAPHKAPQTAPISADNPFSVLQTLLPSAETGPADPQPPAEI